MLSMLLLLSMLRVLLLIIFILGTKSSESKYKLLSSNSYNLNVFSICLLLDLLGFFAVISFFTFSRISENNSFILFSLSIFSNDLMI